MGTSEVISLDDELPGNSEAVKRLRSDIQLAARTDLPVLFLGESGSGKDVAARLVHRLSERRDRAFVAVNLAAIPDSLAAAEMAGYAKGAFTGAERARPGLFELAEGGTILLDELDAASLDVQGVLLSVLEAGSIRRLGEARARALNVRFLAATNVNLDAQVEAGRFRPDLVNRVSAIRIRIPPLRERKADIPVLATAILAKMSAHFGKSFVLARDAIYALKSYDFPGNVRELTNILERAALLADGSSIDAAALDLPKPRPRRQVRPGARVQLELAQRQIEALHRELDALRGSTIPAQPI